MYILASVCDELNIKCDGLSVGTIKKNVTGKGNASKIEVIEAVKQRGFNPIDDNEADALSVLFCGCKSCDNKSIWVLRSPGRERVCRPRDLSSVRKISEVDRKVASDDDFAVLADSKSLNSSEVIDND